MIYYYELCLKDIRSIHKTRIEDKLNYHFDRIRTSVFILFILCSITVYIWTTTLNIPVLIIHSLLIVLIMYDINLSWDKYKLNKTILDNINKGENND